MSLHPTRQLINCLINSELDNELLFILNETIEHTWNTTPMSPKSIMSTVTDLVIRTLVNRDPDRYQTITDPVRHYAELYGDWNRNISWLDNVHLHASRVVMYFQLVESNMLPLKVVSVVHTSSTMAVYDYNRV